MRAAFALLAVAVVAGCSFDWGSLDPREGGGANPATGGNGGTGTGTAGGTSDGGSEAGGGGTGGAQGGGGEGAGMPLNCLSDTFTTFDDTTWEASTTGMGCSVNVDGEVAMICTADALATSRSVTFSSVDTHDITECGIQVEMVDITTDSGTGWHLRADRSNGDLVKFGVVSGSLETFVRVGTSDTTLNTNFDATDMRWLRIKKDSNDCIEFWTSPNGQVWTLRDEVCESFDWSDVTVGMDLSAFNQTDQITVAYDNLGPSG